MKYSHTPKLIALLLANRDEIEFAFLRLFGFVGLDVTEKCH